ncbi:MAG: glutathione S-transferase family protein [Piscirickettsiaceae bacterium CG_4_9_14_3_um_filter_43_564]|nr:glutathione S-transferase family protein [Thiomicrospira sp.]OIP94281.1 MAG: glutathione S-transferase [Thiomicrospira sp. CG2_30_44_34]PIQ02800.1 MAG: glutathione S-transferase [Piscirickettsiaceae bacterium CG18_big_fil_WC_8_21_14_2_50_44_103]PIU38614.1 MAG: glutathione S-transferase family protein [Piscirickettsiaceae bacterium CG07_land_8_20_14_0_80_44_28]PIW58470.1 MAG: glutathione S-transferase family protein [Piscirickettsiaceae bacterium CG12_big_fil_rev_8_21_14_0_65_44_934]PIW78759
MSDKMELVSFKLCPFVQRAVIVLKRKKVDFKITYIDLSNPPEWFESISPLGKVPVLKVGKEVLFESAVIQEYVDEVTPPSLHPEDPLIKAKNRAWMVFGDDLNMLMFKMAHAQSEQAFNELQETLIGKLKQLEGVHSGKAFFNGNTFNLIDAAFAPFFMRLELMAKASGLDFLSDVPKMQKWSDALLSESCVTSSVVKELPQMYLGMIKNVNNSYLASICR